MIRETFAMIDLDKMAFNVRSVRKYVGKSVAIAAVVKANGYGHGSVEIAQTIMENGGDFLAVATLSEALELKKAHKNYTVFIMGYTSNENLKHVVSNDIIQCIFSLEQAEVLNELGRAKNNKPRVHIKYDTGFNRLGFQDSGQSIEEIKKIIELPNIAVEGIFTHLAFAGESEDKRQYGNFINAVNNIEGNGFHFKYKHICDSIAAVDYPEFHLNMIRPGALLYGLKSFRKNDIDLKQVMQFKTKVSNVKSIKKGEGVSYNYKFVADKDLKIATLQVGYADGFPRNMYQVGEVTIRGQLAPIIGVICMDQCMADVSGIPDVKAADEVIIYGDGSNNTVSISSAAERCKTNKNDIVCMISRRTPRVYLKNTGFYKEVNYLNTNEKE